MGDYGTQNLKELIKFVIVGVEETHEAAKNGIGLEDTGNFFTIAKNAPAAYEGIGEIPEEINDLDETEYQEILDYVREEFDIPEDDIEEVIELVFLQVVGMVRLYTKFKALRSKSE